VGGGAGQISKLYSEGVSAMPNKKGKKIRSNREGEGIQQRKKKEKKNFKGEIYWGSRHHKGGGLNNSFGDD